MWVMRVMILSPSTIKVAKKEEIMASSHYRLVLRGPGFQRLFSLRESCVGGERDVWVVNTDFHLLGRCPLRWKEDLGSRSPWVFGSRPAMPVPEKRVYDNELPVGNTSASKQGEHHPGGKYNLKCLY